MRANFDPDTVDWHEFFVIQQGNGYWFEGMPHQRGYGVGAVVGSLFKYLLPIARQIGMELGREGLASGQRILTNMASGQNIKKSLKRESVQGLKNFVDNVYVARSSNTQTGNGRGRKPIKGVRNRKKVIVKSSSIVGKLSRVGPRKRVDILGEY